AAVSAATAKWAYSTPLASCVFHPDALPWRAILLLALPRPGPHNRRVCICRFCVRCGGRCGLDCLAADAKRSDLAAAGSSLLPPLRSRPAPTCQRSIYRNVSGYLVSERPSSDPRIHRFDDGWAVARRILAQPRASHRPDHVVRFVLVLSVRCGCC